MGARRDPGRSEIVEGTQVDRIAFVGRPERCADGLRPADRPFLVAQGAGVPRLEVNPDPTGDEEGAAVHPRLVAMAVHPDVSIHGSLVCRDQVVGPVPETEEVARGRGRGARGRGASEPDLQVAQRGRSEADARQVVNGVERHLGVVGTGLDADVATGQCRVEGVPGEGRQVDQRRRPRCSQPEPVVEERRPKSDGEGETGRLQVQGLAGVGWGSEGSSGPGQGPSCRQLFGRVGPFGEQCGQTGSTGCRHVKGSEDHPGLLRCGDTGLVGSVEGQGDAGVFRGGSGVGRPGCCGGNDRSGRQSGSCQEMAPTERRTSSLRHDGAPAVP